MSYALIKDGAVQRYPYSYTQFRAAHNVSFPDTPSDELLAGYGVYRVAPTDRPTYNAATENLVEGTPALIGGTWTQTWNVAPASAEEIAYRQQQAELAAERDGAKLDAWIVAYLAMTPDEAEQYVLSNTGTLAQMRSIVSKLAYATRVLIRKELGR